MKIQDYLHLYFGCPCIFRYGPTGEWKDGFIKEVALQRVRHGAPYEVKPILRPLSDMTEEEMKELYQIVFDRPFLGNNITHREIGKKEERWVLWSGVERLFIYRDGDVDADSDLAHYRGHAPTILKWQLSKHFDLFGLIAAGLAIDATTIFEHQQKSVL
jgi:hypothetical protein